MRIFSVIIFVPRKAITYILIKIGFLGTKMMTEKMRITQMKIGLQSILALGSWQ
jgi:hypothetical protein